MGVLTADGGCAVVVQLAGKELLDRTTLRLMSGRRYGLVGRNGVGESKALDVRLPMIATEERGVGD